MAKYVAVAGKGGVGKTTFTALMLRQMIREKKGISILAVDADPNANLNEVLGLEVTATISDLLEETKNPKSIPTGMPKDVFVQYKLQQSLVESKDIDLLVMGGPQGPGCYCYPNDLLRKYLEDLGENYDFVAVDTEAGLEHISRRTIPHIDIMFVISDSSARGIRSAGRVNDLIRGLKAEVGEVYLVVTKTVPDSLDSLADEIAVTGLKVIGDIPLDPLVVTQDLAGKALYDLPDEAVSVQAVEKIVRRAGILN
ncbi:CobQ/CobB/MinD/ParA nucleotide binding domain protein [Acididesulfobacillus acetoxydans]|uniref:CobQ/CobB/MinD/ParA nucleotide binding domain protein n=1 Tax=Acididesulfobacillus acetoxydans TaxID=1561005 RepID=A0A8S0X144_9FIRM|nr:AAA family ATPase [Acididesulfobacillus acetoxydans]CAA7602921.1 CobQ/CobB/MinD/ParA nucleotide binding domain protein [Acididesulfobacillus acetoxydans]CEJ05803.1 CobQ/CobB/MinD/ParA nucleotide binding domain protein [Acididesulfobacillus acetoxydans]